MDTDFSVIVPIYKVEKYLRKCIESILAQTYGNLELILVDDGSPDHCPAICDKYALKDQRIRVIHQKNGGLVSARNAGVQAAVGNYICYVDGDDWIVPDLLKTIWEKAIKTYHPDMAVFNMIRQFEEGRQVHIPCYTKEGFYNKEKLEQEIYPYMMYDKRLPFCTALVFPSAGGKVFKRELLLNHYCREERIKMGEDNAFIFECLYASESVFFCQDYLYIYNQLNQGSMVHSYDSNRFENNRLLTDYIEFNLGGKNDVLDGEINAFKAYWLIMAVFHEVKSKKKILGAAMHIKVKIKETNVLKGIRMSGLPKSAQLYLALLKFHMYIPALVGAQVISKIRG